VTVEQSEFHWLMVHGDWTNQSLHTTLRASSNRINEIVNIYEFKYRRRVEFSETDSAGIVYFANFYRYMEEAEHAFLRSLGLSIHIETPDGIVTVPLVRSSCNYCKPLRFEDEIEVHLMVAKIGGKSIKFDFHIKKTGNSDIPAIQVARGSLTVSCVLLDSDRMFIRSVPVPDQLKAKIQEVPSASG
tara:strand:- start:2032 stop:2592 length:561 start_codon:yes stop_codon:yes gene_type:complete